MNNNFGVGGMMLEINNLTIEFNRIILDDVSISFPRGAVTVIKGASGSGKSSLLNVLGLIKKPNKECSYYMDGEAINLDDEDKKSFFRLNHIGFVFQQNNLLQELTALENVMLPMRIMFQDTSSVKKKSQKLIDYVGLNNVTNSYPSDLSGGEEQRVAIARSLINDADVILADEPTASLDPDNSEIILKLFQKLAHDLNKIVIIVSHDDAVAQTADIVYEIENTKLNMIYNRKTALENKIISSKTVGRKSVLSFIRFYTRKRKKEKKLNKTLIIITAMIAAICTLFTNFGDTFSNQQKNFLNSITDRNLFVINDTMGLNSQTDYADALRFSDEQIQKIKEIPNVNKIYPYYEFTSFGITESNKETAQITIQDNTKIIKEISYDNSLNISNNGTAFRITPLYPEEKIENVLKYTDSTTNIRDGLILTTAFAKKLSSDPNSLIGKTFKIKCFVPVKLFESKATKPQGKAKTDSAKNEETVKIDGPICKLITISEKITGILSDSYSNQRSEENQNLILFDYSKMEKLLSDNKDTNYKETFPGFPEEELGPSALSLYVTSYDDIQIVKSKIENISPAITVISKASDIRKIQTNLQMVKNIMHGVSLILVIIVIIMLYLLYYFKNRTRKKEIGILKALGLTSKDVVFLIGYEMLIVALKTFILSLTIAIFLMLVFNSLIGLKGLFLITFGSIIFCFFLTFFIVIIASISSIWRTSRIDIIDAIRNNK